MRAPDSCVAAPSSENANTVLNQLRAQFCVFSLWAALGWGQDLVSSLHSSWLERSMPLQWGGKGSDCLGKLGRNTSWRLRVFGLDWPELPNLRMWRGKEHLAVKI